MLTAAARARAAGWPISRGATPMPQFAPSFRCRAGEETGRAGWPGRHGLHRPLRRASDAVIAAELPQRGPAAEPRLHPLPRSTCLRSAGHHQVERDQVRRVCCDADQRPRPQAPPPSAGAHSAAAGGLGALLRASAPLPSPVHTQQPLPMGRVTVSRGAGMKWVFIAWCRQGMAGLAARWAAGKRARSAAPRSRQINSSGA